MREVCVLGLGYIGLPTASILATHGFAVTGVDIDPRTLKILGRGDIHIEEPGLKTLFQASIKSKSLTFSRTPRPSDAFIICVPTPADHATKKADLRAVKSAARSIIPVLRPGNLVILESTVGPGTMHDVLLPILRKSRHWQEGSILVAHCPERVLPGQILRELVANDRIIGGIDYKSALAAKEIYAKFCSGNIHLTDALTAELAKLAENTFRDVNIAYANELDRICEDLGANTWEVIRLANRHPRVKILDPGPGVGGHCIAIDPWFLAMASPKKSRLIQTARAINEHRPLEAAARIKAALAKTGKKHPIAVCLGLSYKANVDDFRESPAMDIFKNLLTDTRITTLAVEPYGAKLNGSLPLTDLTTALNKADVIAILVDQKEFMTLDWKHLIAQKGLANIIDFRGIINKVAA
ncbi:MAG: nucleotide sugar dehydrogenase [Elusimicrobiota bacterium]